MPRLEPALLRVVTDLERGLRALDVPFAVVGALVPELLLESALSQFEHPDAGGAHVVLTERGHIATEDDARVEVCEAFQWYRRGLGL